ncbi:CD48 antigen-like [Enoplosus armatus]|uniref:CD48 antigen-like n=1 Tax=Enoplosus armatus TaxID=215367 RepID=UPI0039957487
MDKQTGLWLLTALLLAVNSAPAEGNVKQEYFEVGGELALRPSFSKAISSILWKHEGNLLAEWVKDQVELTYYGEFEGRTTLDLSTGSLAITKMNSTDIGMYSLEINNQVQSPSYRVKSIKAVPEPVVWLRPLTCTPALDRCKLTCDGDTAEAEPVTYSWRGGDGEWELSAKDIDIIKAETAQIKTYSCRIKNPVSMKESGAKANPFFKETNNHAVGIGLGVGLPVLALIVGGLLFWKKDHISESISKRQGGNISAGSAGGNGQPPETETLKAPDIKTDDV